MSIRRHPKEGEGTGSLIQRCVIVQKDENGYGLTVSGDNPVYVQSVRENGSAVKAGVQVGDRIIKVNGVLVTKSNHIEVVKLIKSGSYVALTLLGKPPGERPSSGTASPVGERSFSYNRNYSSSTSPTQKEFSDAYQHDRIVALQRMLDQEHLYYNRTLECYKSAPSSKLQKDLADSQTRIKAIENQIRVISSNHVTHKQLTSQSTRAVFKPIVENRPASPKGVGHNRSKSAYAIRSQSSSSIPHAASFACDYPRSDFDVFPRSSSVDYSGQSDSPPPDNKQVEDGDQPGTQPVVTSVPPKPILHHSSESVPPTITERSESPPVVEVNEQTMESENIYHKREHDDSDTIPSSPSPPKLQQLSSLGPEESAPLQDGVFQGGKIEHLQPLHPAMSVISMEDEEFESDNEKIDDHGPFVDLNCLKNKPAHLAIFLHFLMSNSDPSALFFWLVTEIYAAEQGSVKDFKKWAYEIYSVFLAPNAPLKVPISEAADQAIEESLNSKNSTEDGLRNIFKTGRLYAFNEVSEQLADFRNKRALGLGTLFGDHQLEDDLDKVKELKVVEDTLLPHLEALVCEAESGSNGSAQHDRNSAMASSLATFMKQVRNNVKPGSSQASPLDKCRSFVEKERSSLFKFRPSKKTYSIKGHQFVTMQYTTITPCNYCNETLWGIGHQGYQCTACEYNVHKGVCADSVDEVCPGSKRKAKDRSKGWRIAGKGDTKQRMSTKDASLDDLSSTSDSRLDVQSLTSETRSRDNSFHEDSSKTPSVYSREPLLSGEEPNLSETESERTDRSASNSIIEEQTTHHIPQSSSIRFKPSESWRREKFYGNAVDRSISLRTPRDLAKIQDKKRSIPPLPGLQIKGERGGGFITDNGVYAPHPFPGPKSISDSPPISEDEEEWDSDLDVDEETPIWSQVVDKKTVKGLKNKELKRQEVIHELIHTEKTHVRKLRLLEKVFYKPMKKRNIMTPEALQQLFPNLEELIQIHTSLLAAMKARSAENEVVQAVGDIMLARFDGSAGESVKEAAAKFCNYQKIALEVMKNRQKKDPKFNAFMMQQEGDSLCRRLKFPDIIASTHQRFTKYPLLLEGIAKATLQNHGDRKEVERCVECCKAILNHINQTIKETENAARLLELSKKIEVKQVEGPNQMMKKEIMELDITKHKLIYEGDLTWRITRTKSIELHALLLDDVLALLQKQDEKFVLKCHSTTAGTSLETKKNTHSPVIKLANLLTRNVATDKKAFFLVSTSALGPQIYEMVTGNTTERRLWVKLITDAAESAKGKERGRRGGLSLETTPAKPESNDKNLNLESSTRAPVRKDSDDDDEEEDTTQSDTSVSKSDVSESKRKSPVDFDKLTNETVVDDTCETETVAVERVESVEGDASSGVFEKKFQAPTKERMFFLYEQLKCKDEELKRAMEEKEKIVAELRGEKPGNIIMPEGSNYETHIEPRELVLAAILQANRLTLAVNDVFNMHRAMVSEGNDISEGSLSTSPLPMSHLEDRFEPEEESQRPDIILEATATLNEQLTALLGLITDRDNARERLQSELQSAKATIQRMSQPAFPHSISQESEQEEQAPPIIEITSELVEPQSPPASLQTLETVEEIEGTFHGSIISDSDHPSEDQTVVSGLNSDMHQEDSIFVTSPFKSPTPRTSDPSIGYLQSGLDTGQTVVRSNSLSGAYVTGD